MNTNSTRKNSSYEIPKANMESLKVTVTNNLMNIQNVQNLEDLYDKTYKQLGELCDVDFRTIKRWVTGETKSLAIGPYEKIASLIDKVEVFQIRNSKELFLWARRSDLTHIILEYKWGTKTVTESKPLWDLAREDIFGLIRGYKEGYKITELTDLLLTFENNSVDIISNWKNKEICVSATDIPPFSLPEELIDPDQVYNVAVFYISSDGYPEKIYKPDWSKVQPI